jgi:hypothetical protein
MPNLTFTTHEKIILATIAVLIVIIPITSFVVAYRFRAQTNSKAFSDEGLSGFNEPVTAESTASALESLKGNLADNNESDYGVDPSQISSSPTPNAQLILGPSLNFQVKIEGRTVDQTSKQFFVGIAEGENPDKPRYLLSFKVDIPSSGKFTNLSLSGLSSGTTYTAYLKGRGQIATSSAFTLGPTETNLDPINLLSGDLNEDNMVNNTDLTAALSTLNATPSSPNWNENMDFNKDNKINNLDLAYIYKNMNKTGAGGAWFSKVGGSPQNSATSAASTSPSPAGNPVSDPPPNSSKGYWMWMPSL